MVERNAQATKERILVAATAEFAQHGIAGARVDRIAAAAKANKNLIYVHFGSKDGLFAAVGRAVLGELLDAVPITPADLPGYAGRLYDHFLTHPAIVRLVRWYGLERPAVLPHDAGKGTKVAAVAEAQAAGLVDAGLAPELLMPLILSMAWTWAEGSPEGGEPDVDPAVVALRRHALVVAVGRIVRPPSTGSAERATL